MRKISLDTFGTVARVSDIDEPEDVTDSQQSTEGILDVTACQPGLYVAAIYDHQWYIGLITDRSHEGQDILVKFMTKTQSKASCRLTWPKHDDTCWVPVQHVLSLVPAPEARSNSARQYQLDNSAWQTVKKEFAAYAQKYFHNI